MKRINLNNYIKKRYLLFSFIFLSILFLSINFFPKISYSKLPKPQGYITDNAHLLSGSTRSRIEGLIRELHLKTSSEIAVVTIKTFDPYSSIEEYAVELFEEWGIGEKNKDNGVLFLVSITEKKIKIEVGYGLEGAIPDARAGDIIRRIITPAFKEGDFNLGILGGTKAIVQYVAGEYGVTITGAAGYPSQVARQKISKKNKFGIGDIFSLLFSLFILLAILRRPSLLLFFLLGSGMQSNWSSGRGGSFGGGFGGFGGGMSGGGGASGGW